MVTPNAGGIVRQEFSGLELRQSAERAALARAAHSEALVRSRVALALQNPRDVDRARQAILKDAQRPVFAERAIYSKPVGGKKIEGPSVRLAESLARAWGNIFIEVTITYEDAETRTVHILVMDVEENVTSAGEIIIEKTVERRDAKDRTVLSERVNSTGQKTYRVLGTEDEILNKMNAAISKMRRNKIIELLPFDIVQEALDLCKETTRNNDAKDPDAAKRRVLDAFAELGVDVDDVREYLERDSLDKLTPAELADLRKAYAAIESGESSWGQIMELRDTQRKAKVSAPVAPPPPAAQGAPATSATAPTGAQPAEASPRPAAKPEESKPAEAPAPTEQPAPAPAPSPAPNPPADDAGNKLADEVIAQMRTAAEAGDKKRVITIASEAAKDKRIPQERRKEIGDKFAELNTLASENAKKKGGA